MSNYCACSGGDEEYTIELNQQGPEGPQGEVGPEGFSPSISVKTSTDKAYILTVVNKEETFDTPNLYGDIEKLNADLSNIPNPAFINGVSLYRSNEDISSIELNGSSITTDINGNLMLTATASNEVGTEVFNYKVVVNPKDQHLELHDNEGNVKIVATTDQQTNVDIATTTTAGIVKPDGSTITVTPDGTISAVQPDLSNLATKEELASTNATVTNLQTSVASNTTSIGTLREDLTNLETTVGNNSADIAALDADKLEQSNIIAGANITIDRNGNNLTINSIGGGSGGSSIDDSTISSASTWSSSKITSEITTVANTKNNNIFDINKFTVFGTPTISDDGVVTNFSNSSYIRTQNNFSIDVSKNFEVHLKLKNIKYNPSLGDTGVLRFITETGYARFTLRYNGKTFYLVSGGADNNSQTTGIKLFDYGRDMDIEIIFGLEDNATFYSKIKRSYDTYWLNLKTTTITIDDTFGSAYVDFGRGWDNYMTTETGSIDLKQFSLTVDGKEVFSGLMESTKPIYDKLSSTSTELSTFKTDTDNNFSAVNSALNEKANLSDLAGYVPLTKYNELLARVVALETEINGGNA